MGGAKQSTYAKEGRRAAGIGVALFSGLVLGAAASPAWASVDDEVLFTAPLAKDYLLISKSIQSGTTAIDVNGGGTGSFGTNTLGWVPELPSSAPSIPAGIASPVTGTPTFDGDVALLDEDGTITYSDLDVYGDVDQGIVGRPTINFFTDNQSQLSDARFDNGDGSGLQGFAVDRGLERFAPAASATTTQDVDAISAEIDNARTVLMSIESLTPDVSINTDGGDIKSDQTVTLNNPGLNVVGFSNTGGGDITLDGANLIFEAPDGATPGDRQAVVFVPDTANFKISNGNVLVGDNMGAMDVVFVSFREDNATHFDFSNAVLNGVAFWDLFREVDTDSDASEISLDNVSGNTQFIGDKINLSSEIHLSTSGFRGIIPEPATFALFAAGVAAVAGGRRRGP